MPVEMIESPDTITSMVEFRTSPVYEMMVSLHTLVTGRRHQELANAARTALGAEFWSELDALYRPFQEGVVLFELPVNYANHDDVSGFIQYVQEMDPATFIFYFIGRIIPLDVLKQNHVDPRVVIGGLDDYCTLTGHPPCSYVPALNDVLKDVPAYQARLTSMWERYWTGFFRDQIDPLPGRWSQAIAEKASILARSGGRALLEMTTGTPSLPRNLPEDQPITEATFVPIYFVTAPSYRFFGYGNVTVLFDCERTQERVTEIEKLKDEAVEVARSLSDPTRLRVLKLIAERSWHWHGKKIAEKLDLSPSTVSRQLAQLRDSGLLIEERHDDQTVTYRLVEDAITSLPKKILEYLYS